MATSLEDKEVNWAKAYRNSKPLYAWRVSDYPEVKAVIKHIFLEMTSEGLISKRYADKYSDPIRIIVLDLFVAHQSDPKMFIAYQIHA